MHLCLQILIRYNSIYMIHEYMNTWYIYMKWKETVTWSLTSEVLFISSSVHKLSVGSNEAHKKIPKSSSWSHHHRQTRSSLKWEEKQNLKNQIPHCFERAVVPLQWVVFLRGLIKQQCSLRSELQSIITCIT